MKTAWLKIKAFLQTAEQFNPARVRAAWVAAAALAATLGLTKEYTSADAKVQGILGFLAVLLPILQGEWTRSKVTPPGNLEPNNAADHPVPAPAPVDSLDPIADGTDTIIPIGDPDSIEPPAGVAVD